MIMIIVMTMIMMMVMIVTMRIHIDLHGLHLLLDSVHAASALLSSAVERSHTEQRKRWVPLSVDFAELRGQQRRGGQAGQRVREGWGPMLARRQKRGAAGGQSTHADKALR